MTTTTASHDGVSVDDAVDSALGDFIEAVQRRDRLRTIDASHDVDHAFVALLHARQASWPRRSRTNVPATRAPAP
jgi:hypothetical protein